MAVVKPQTQICEVSFQSAGSENGSRWYLHHESVGRWSRRSKAGASDPRNAGTASITWRLATTLTRQCNCSIGTDDSIRSHRAPTRPPRKKPYLLVLHTIMRRVRRHSTRMLTCRVQVGDRVTLAYQSIPPGGPHRA
jgi:hypothetical protein